MKKKAQIAKDFQIPPDILSTYLKNKEKILNIKTNENWKDRKRKRGTENPEVEECVLKWSQYCILSLNKPSKHFRIQILSNLLTEITD